MSKVMWQYEIIALFFEQKFQSLLAISIKFYYSYGVSLELVYVGWVFW
jgi:hypothetical protein